MKRALPDVDPLRLELVAASSNVVLRGEASLFRVAPLPRLAESHRQSVALLSCLREQLPWQLPRVLEWIDLPPSVLRLDWIEGADAGRLAPALAAAPQERQAALGEALGRGLATLHSLDLPDLAARDDLAWQSVQLAAQANTLRAAGDPRGAIIAEACKQFPVAPTVSGDLRPGHGDFLPPNILLREEDLALAGVIDFDRVGLHDPAADLGGLLQLPPVAAAAGLAAYRAAGVALPPPERLRSVAVHYAARALTMGQPAGWAERARRLQRMIETDPAAPPG